MVWSNYRMIYIIICKSYYNIIQSNLLSLLCAISWSEYSAAMWFKIFEDKLQNVTPHLKRMQYKLKALYFNNLSEWSEAQVHFKVNRSFSGIERREKSACAWTHLIFRTGRLWANREVHFLFKQFGAETSKKQ